MKNIKIILILAIIFTAVGLFAQEDTYRYEVRVTYDTSQVEQPAPARPFSIWVPAAAAGGQATGQTLTNGSFWRNDDVTRLLGRYTPVVPDHPNAPECNYYWEPEYHDVTEDMFEVLAGGFDVKAHYNMRAPIHFVLREVCEEEPATYILNVNGPAGYSFTGPVGYAGEMGDDFESIGTNELLGDWTAEDAPIGWYWAVNPIEVVEGDFVEVAPNVFEATIEFVLLEDVPTTPVELSSFTATATAQNYVKLNWVTQTETGMIGYRVYRNTTDSQETALMITPIMIPATNTSSTQIYIFEDREVENGTYWYWLESVDYNASSFHGPTTVIVQGEIIPELPNISELKNAYPNPFKVSASTNIEVNIKAGETGVVTIYNILGQVVQTYNVNAGEHKLNWNGRDARGNAVGSGIYFYKLSTPSTNQTKKMVIVK